MEKKQNTNCISNRLGQSYKSYRTEEDLSETAKAFFKAAAEVACTTVKGLMSAVLHSEAKITRWMRAKRRAEFTGEEFDLDAEIGGGAAEDGLEKSTRLQQNMEATNIRDVGNVKNEGGRDEDSDIDMQMNS